MSPQEWDELDWLYRKTYIDGFELEGLISLEHTGSGPAIEEDFAASLGMQTKQVEAAEDQFDLAGMKAELEALRGG